MLNAQEAHELRQHSSFRRAYGNAFPVGHFLKRGVRWILCKQWLDHQFSHCSSHNNWIRFIRFIDSHDLLSQSMRKFASDADASCSRFCEKHNVKKCGTPPHNPSGAHLIMHIPEKHLSRMRSSRLPKGHMLPAGLLGRPSLRSAPGCKAGHYCQQVLLCQSARRG